MSDPNRIYRPRTTHYPLARGAVDLTDIQGMAAMMSILGDAELPSVEKAADEPFVGLTTDGTPVSGLFTLGDEQAPTAAAAAATTAYLNRLTAEQMSQAVLPIDAVQWRIWINAFLTFPEHGLLLDEMDPLTRDAVLAIIEASCGAVGFAQVRHAMQLNGELGEFVGNYPDTLTEYCYWFTVFGDPSLTEPWGWQLLGHHIDLHYVFIGNQMINTPAFLGTEFQGETLFVEHRSRALEFMDSLSAAQRDRAVLYDSILSTQLPRELAGMVDGRHRGGAGRDNLILPYEGISGDQLTPGQQELLLALTEPYLATLPEGPRTHRRNQVRQYIDHTHLAWIGTTEPEDPFYYRIHSPVILIEYDNHAGIFLDNDEAEPYHVHTIVRTPNGGDYAKNHLHQYRVNQHSGHET